MTSKELFTKENIDYLKKLGEEDKDIKQIKRAFRILKITKNDEQITKEQALSELGIKDFLSGLERASFHWTASREDNKENNFFFDCSSLFKNI